jgi:hypothetical protein
MNQLPFRKLCLSLGFASIVVPVGAYLAFYNSRRPHSTLDGNRHRRIRKRIDLAALSLTAGAKLTNNVPVRFIELRGRKQ